MGGGTRGHGPPKALKVLFSPPPNGKLSTIKTLLYMFCFYFLHIFKIKWPKSEEELKFGVRLGWGPDQLAIKPTGSIRP